LQRIKKGLKTSWRY